MRIWRDASAGGAIKEGIKIDAVAEELYNRIQDEAEKILKSQMKILGFEFPGDFDRGHGIDLKKTLFPMDDNALAIYEINGIKILGIRISDNRMSIEFDTPKIETQKGEVHDV